jgi:4-amino-4-deoxy-L-arabinose transferase-like glycosyltransferase
LRRHFKVKTSTERRRWTALALLALASGLVSIPWWGHVDDVDAQFYRVVTRHMVQDDTWLRLRFLPRLFPTFREHVPFGFWPWAAADRLLGEWALGPLSALFTLATLMLVLRLGRRLGGEAVAVPAVMVLIATDSFLLIGGRSRLDPLLYLFTTA